MTFDGFVEICEGCFVKKCHIESFKALGLCSVDDFVSFDGGKSITKPMAKYRKRQVFTAGEPEKNFYLKTYNNPPLKVQITNWLDHRKRASTAAYDYMPAFELETIGIKTPTVAAFGEIFGGLFEKKSFIVTEEIDDAKSLENNPPQFFKPAAQNRQRRLKFIEDLALITKKFHAGGFFHRDYYLCHIFWGEKTGFQIIDLQRIFTPLLLRWKYRIKDIAQLYYSAPLSVYSKADRLRFFKIYADKKTLTVCDRWFISCVKSKAAKMAAHDKKKGKQAPYKN